MNNLHPLLLRQIKKSAIDLAHIDPALEVLLSHISRSYQDADNERYTAERSNDIATEEMRHLRDHLSKEREYLHSIMSEGYCIVNASWQVTNLNREGERILGVQFEQVSGQRIDDVLHVYVDEELKTLFSLELMKDAVQKGVQLSESRAYVESEKNRAVPISYSVNPLPYFENKQFSGAVFVIRDIAEYVKFEKSLHDAMLEAKKSNEIKSIFLANMSHEIRTPMNGILGMLQLLAATELSPLQREYVEVALTSGDNLLNLIGDILDFSKIESNKIQIEENDFDLYHELTAVEGLFKAELEKKKISYGLVVAPTVPRHIRADSFRIRQILLNLVSNAIKFTQESGEIIVRVSLQNDNQLKMSVTDNGIGINSEALSKLFQPFTQADTSITRRYGGTGLGLVICKKLIEKMHGQISVESVQSRGSTFIITFPFKEVSKSELSPMILHQSKVVETSGNLNPSDESDKRHQVMVVDDNPINQRVVTEMLKKLQCEVVTASNGQEALDLLKKKPFEIVFMDCHMPVMDGFEATLKIREAEQRNEISYHGQPTKIVALTADAFQSSKDKCLSLGMNDFIPKPFKLQHLQSVIKKILNQPPN